MLPGPKSVPTRSVLSSTHAIPDFASGTLNPSGTKCLVVRSNSRNSVASEPPRQAEDAAPVFGFEAGRARPGPRHALSLAQRIEVDHGLPHRIRAGVARACGPPPNAALVIGVLPG